MQFVYDYDVYRSDDGAWQVRFPSVPEALTEGETEADAHALAADALLAALGGLVKLRKPIPDSEARGEFHVVVPILQAAKLALYRAMREQKLNNVTLADRLGVQEGEVRRWLDLDHSTKIATIENALWHLGRQIAGAEMEREAA
jgi:antitoxin HicB